MKKFVIFDVDNCISDDAYRIPMIAWSRPAGFYRWHNYHLTASFDFPGNLHVMAGIRADRVIIFTAMPEHYRAARNMWLNRWHIGFNRMYMRPDDHVGASEDLKREMLYQFYGDFGACASDISVAYDDRESTVDMYKSEGVNAELLSIHDVCAMTPPKLEIVR